MRFVQQKFRNIFPVICLKFFSIFFWSASNMPPLGNIPSPPPFPPNMPSPGGVQGMVSSQRETNIFIAQSPASTSGSSIDVYTYILIYI